MTRIILIRHGQTEWNEGEGERFRGRSELDLDEVGIRQAEATAARIGSWRVEAIYSSPLRRAMTTAQIIARPFDLQAQPLQGLIDIDYGKWQGLSLNQAEARDSHLYSLWLHSPHLVTFPQGESLEQVRDRAVAALEGLLPGHSGQTIALVSHKVVCKVLLCSLLDLDNSTFWRVEQSPCAIDIIEGSGQILTVKSLNDTCHLKSLK